MKLLDMTLSNKKKIKPNALDFIKIKSLCLKKNLESKRDHIKWEEIFSNHIPSKMARI